MKAKQIVQPLALLFPFLLGLSFGVFFFWETDEEVTFKMETTDMEPAIKQGEELVIEPVKHWSDVETLVEDGAMKFGMPGDVIAYHVAGNELRPLLVRRVVGFVNVTTDSYGSPLYLLKWENGEICPGGNTPTDSDGNCRYGVGGISSRHLGVTDYKPRSAGFITKGDKLPTADQDGGSVGTVQISWIEGKIVKKR